MKNSLFNGMKIIMIQAIPACYRDIFEERRNIKAQVYGYNSKRFNTVNGLCIYGHTDYYYMRSSAVIPSTSSVFFKVIPKALTRPRRAILTSLSCSLSTGTFS